MIKRYFILLIFTLALSRIGGALVMVIGPKAFMSFIHNPEDFTNAFRRIVDIADLISYYFFTTLLGIILFIDLKKNLRLIGLPILTIFAPVISVTLFLLRDFYINKNN